MDRQARARRRTASATGRPPVNPVAGIPSANVQPVGVLDEGRTCCCVDEGLERLRGLVADGMSQMEASRLLWAPVIGEVDREAARVTLLERMRDSFVERHPWLRLGEA